MRNVRAARQRPPATVATAGHVGGPPPAVTSALHRGWYLPEPTAAGWPLPPDITAHLDTVLGPQASCDTVIVIAFGVALWAFDQLRAAVTEPQQPLTARTLADLVTGLNLAQAHLVQDAQDLALRLSHLPEGGLTAISARTAEMLAGQVSDAARYGELAAALFHEGRLALPPP